MRSEGTTQAESGAQAPGDIGRRYVGVGESLPIPGAVDWTEAPGPFKLYRGMPRIALGYDESSHPARGNGTDRSLGFDQVGQLLSDAYGLTRQRWIVPDAVQRLIGSTGAAVVTDHVAMPVNLLRPVPSGGARFPMELYVVAGPDTAVPAGVHHYDPAHHSLVTVRAGDGMSTLATSLGRPDGRGPSLALLVTIFFWKNVFKYGELGYRLCGFDAGALIGQVLAVAAHYAPRTKVHYQFLDRDLDGLLQLDPSRESVYSVITLGEDGPIGPGKADPPTSGAVAIPRTGTSTAEQSWSIRELPLLARLHHASHLSTVESFLPEGAVPALATQTTVQRSVALPQPRVNLLDGVRNRRSSMGYFEPAELPLQQLSELLGAAARGYDSDLDGHPPRMAHTGLYCAINNVETAEPGVYHYAPDSHSLEQVRAGDVRGELQATLLGYGYNLTHTSLCLYPVADYERGLSVYGDRWYRMQNMEAGIMLQRLYLVAGALGIMCRANLGFSVAGTKSLLGLEPGSLTSLIQVMIGSGHEPGSYYEAAVR